MWPLWNRQGRQSVGCLHISTIAACPEATDHAAIALCSRRRGLSTDISESTGKRDQQKKQQKEQLPSNEQKPTHTEKLFCIAFHLLHGSVGYRLATASIPELRQLPREVGRHRSNHSRRARHVQDRFNCADLSRRSGKRRRNSAYDNVRLPSWRRHHGSHAASLSRAQRRLREEAVSSSQAGVGWREINCGLMQTRQKGWRATTENMAGNSGRINMEINQDKLGRLGRKPAFTLGSIGGER